MSTTSLERAINGRTVAAGRSLLGLKQGPFAKLCGLSSAAVSQIERREGVPGGQASSLQKILKVFSDHGVEVLGNEELRGPNANRNAPAIPPQEVRGASEDFVPKGIVALDELDELDENEADPPEFAEGLEDRFRTAIEDDEDDDPIGKKADVDPFGDDADDDDDPL